MLLDWWCHFGNLNFLPFYNEAVGSVNMFGTVLPLGAGCL